MSTSTPEEAFADDRHAFDPRPHVQAFFTKLKAHQPQLEALLEANQYGYDWEGYAGPLELLVGKPMRRTAERTRAIVDALRALAPHGCLSVELEAILHEGALGEEHERGKSKFDQQNEKAQRAMADAYLYAHAVLVACVRSARELEGAEKLPSLLCMPVGHWYLVQLALEVEKDAEAWARARHGRQEHAEECRTWERQSEAEWVAWKAGKRAEVAGQE